MRSSPRSRAVVTRPPDARSGPGQGQGHPQTPQPNVVTAMVAADSDVLARVIDLHHRGYLTRDEIEREYGAPYDQVAASLRLPAPQPVDWPAYTVVTLGMVPHQRDTCAACQAVA